MTIDLSMAISIVSVLAAVFFGYQAFARNNTSDVEEKASMNARVLTKLDSISDDIKDMKRDNQDLRKEVSHINNRVIVLEQIAKAGFKESNIAALKEEDS